MRVFPVFPIGLVLEHYGGEPCEEDLGWRKYRCPFHDERTPSASVNTTLQVFVCHGCEVKGNATQCIMKHEGVKYAVALERAKAIAGGSLPEVHGERNGGKRISGQPRNRSGARAFRRSWRSS